MNRIKIGYMVVQIITSFLLALILTNKTNVSLQVKEVIEVFLFYLFSTIFLSIYFIRNKVILSRLIGGYPSIRYSIKTICYTVILVVFLLAFTGFFIMILNYTGFNFSNDNYVHRNLIVIPLYPIIFDRFIRTFFIPVVEEIFFRGIVFHVLGLKYGLKKSIILTSLVFSSLHVNIIWAFLFSIVAMLLYIKTRSLFYPIMLHITHNLIVTLIVLIAKINYCNKVNINLMADISFGVGVNMVVLVVTIIWLILFIKKNWPKSDCKMPYYIN